jgi:hypothetical protein
MNTNSLTSLITQSAEYGRKLGDLQLLSNMHNLPEGEFGSKFLLTIPKFMSKCR